MALATLTLDLVARFARFETDLGRVAHLAERNAQQMQRAFARVGSTLAALGTGVSFAALIAPVKNVIELGDQIEKLSQKVGISVQSLSELRFAAELSDVSTEQFAKGMKGLSLAVVEANDRSSKMAQIFSALGVDVKRGPLSTLMQLADAVKALGDGELKTALSTQLMQKAGMDLIPMLNQGSEGLNKSAEKARNLGLAMGPDFTKNSEQFNDNLRTLTKGAEAFGIKVASFVLPGLVTFTDQVARSAESGDKLLGFLKESVRLAAALGATFNLIGESSMDRLFKNAPNFGGPVKGLIRGPDGKPVAGAVSGALPPDTAALSCVLSGGKWVGGKCVRETAKKGIDENAKLLEAGTRGWIAYADAVMGAADAENTALGAGKSFSEWAEKIRDEALDNIDPTRKWAREVADLTTLLNTGYLSLKQFNDAAVDPRLRELLTPLKTDMDLLNEALKEGDIGLDKYLETVARIGEKIKATGDKMSEFAIQAARSMEVVLAGGLFDLMQGRFDDFGKRFKSTVDGMVSHLLASQLLDFLAGDFGQTKNGTVVKTVGGFIGKVIESIPKFDVGTPFVPRDMVAVVHRGERIVPAAENRAGMMNATVNINVYGVQNVDGFRASERQIMDTARRMLAGR